MFAYGVIPGTLADIMKDKVDEGYAYSTVYKTKVNGEYELNNVKISELEGIDYLWRNLKETEVSFKKVTRPPELMDGEVWYEITDMQHLKSIQITDSGEVHTMAFHIPQLSVVYSISDEDKVVLFERIEQIRDIYSDKDNTDNLNYIPKMDVEAENGAHITGVVLVHDGRGSPLSEEEFNLLKQGVEPEEILKER